MKLAFLFIALVWFSVEAVAQDTSMSLVLDDPSNEIQLGERFRVTVSRSWPAGFVPAPFDTEALSPVRVLEVSRTGGIDQRSEILHLVCILFRPGTTTIGRIRFSAMPQSRGREFVAFSEPFVLSVATLLSSDDDGVMEGAGLPLSVPISVGSIIRGCLLGVFLLGIFLGVRLFKVEYSSIEAGQRLLPSQIAEKDLRELNRQDPGLIEWCDGCSRIVRGYLVTSLGADCASATVEELEEDIRTQTNGSSQALLLLLKLTDAARFSGQPPTSEDLDAFSTAWREELDAERGADS